MFSFFLCKNLSNIAIQATSRAVFESYRVIKHIYYLCTTVCTKMSSIFVCVMHPDDLLDQNNKSKHRAAGNCGYFMYYVLW